MPHEGCCWGNPPMEGFLQCLRRNAVVVQGELTVDGFMKQIDDYMDYCNREHCSLKLKNRVLLYIEPAYTACLNRLLETSKI